MAAVRPTVEPRGRRGSSDRAVSAVLAFIVAAAALLRFYGLAWGAPYFHFHIDEHYVFVGAALLRTSMRAAAHSGKFFMYGPVPMHVLNAVVWVYEHVKATLVLNSSFQDQVTYMVMGRAISVAMGTSTVLLVYFIGKRVSGRVAGLLAAALLATTVVHIAESHSFRVDLTMIFFVTLAWLFAFQIAEHGRWTDYMWAGAAVGAAVGSKFSAAFIFGVIAVAHLMTPRHPQAWTDIRGWLAWTLRGLSPILSSVVVFAIVNPMAFIYYDRFRQDVQEQIINPVLTGSVRPVFMSQFADVQPQLYWLTNLWWSFGPGLEGWGLLGVLWLLWRRSRVTWLAAAFPVLYLLTAAGTSAPMARYTLPLAPAFAVAAGAFSEYLFARPRWRRAGIAATVAVVATTAVYALAYMHIYASPDARLAASEYLRNTVPKGARILVEPSHGIPPTGSYLEKPDFYGNYVVWGLHTESRDYYTLYGLDLYDYLFRAGVSPRDKREYIQSRLDLADYIVMDDFYLQLYQHLPLTTHEVVKYYYRQLFRGELGFDLMQTFKVYPSIVGVTINDDGAELSSRMNDHPRVYVFKRRQPRS